MIDFGFGPYSNFKHMDVPIVTPNLRTGVGRGHCRDFYRERPAKNAVKKARKHTKMKKASRRRNRK